MSYNIKKRDGKEVLFNKDKIVSAILSAMVEVNEFDYDLAEKIAQMIELDGTERTVRDIERRVIGELYRANFNKAADAYSEYKARRDLARIKGKKERRFLTEDFLSTYKHKPDPFTNELGKFVYYRTYSRPIPEENRRERWWETVARVVEFSFDLQMIAMKRQGIAVNERLMESLRKEARETYDMMFHLKLFPSGRTLWVNYCPLY
jgi:ribonucleotide reductase alpha subunit